MLGVLQYIAPTGQFLIAVFVFNEPFPPDKMVGFSIIWLALLLFWLEGVVHRRRMQGRAAATVEARAASR
jgi:chloramphenicol-sensitive protein RarD